MKLLVQNIFKQSFNSYKYGVILFDKTFETYLRAVCKAHDVYATTDNEENNYLNIFIKYIFQTHKIHYLSWFL